MGIRQRGEAARSICCSRLPERPAARLFFKKHFFSRHKWRRVCVTGERAAAEWALWRLGVRAGPETKQLVFVSLAPLETKCLYRRVQPHSSSAPEPERVLALCRTPKGSGSGFAPERLSHGRVKNASNASAKLSFTSKGGSYATVEVTRQRSSCAETSSARRLSFCSSRRMTLRS